MAPALIKASIYPRFIACLYISRDAGNINNLTLSLIFCPFNISYASFKSDNLPFVQEPIKHWSIEVPSIFDMSHTLSTSLGQAI